MRVSPRPPSHHWPPPCLCGLLCALDFSNKRSHTVYSLQWLAPFTCPDRFRAHLCRHISALHSSMLPDDSPFCEYTTFHLSIHQLMDIWIVSSFEPSWVIAERLSTRVRTCVFISLECIPVRRVASSYGDVMFNILNSCRTVFQSGCTILQSHQQYMRILISPYPCQPLLYFCLYDYSHSSGYEVVS